MAGLVPAIHAFAAEKDVVALLAAAACWFSGTRLLPVVWLYAGYALALVAVVLLAQKWFQWWITEIASPPSSHLQEGLVELQTNEMNMDKVESVQNVLQFPNRSRSPTSEGAVPDRGTGKPAQISLDLNSCQSVMEAFSATIDK